VSTIASLAGTAAGLGIPDYLVRRVAQRPELAEREAGGTILVTLLAALVGGIALAVVFPLTGFPLEDNRLLYVALLGMLAVPVQGALFSWLRGRDANTRYAWSNAASVVVWAIVGVVALWAGANVLTYTLLGALVPLGVALAAFKLSGLRPAIPTWEVGPMRDLVRGGLPFLGCTLTQLLAFSIDRVILGALVPAAEVGWYAAANRIVYIPIFIPHLFATPLFAAVSRLNDDPVSIRRAMAESVRLVLLLTVPLSAGLIVVAPLVPNFLGWPTDFVNTVPLMQIMSASMPVMSVNTVLVSGLMALGYEGKWAWVSVVVAGLNAVVNLACIPWFETVAGDGAIGAAIVTGVTELLMFAGVLVLIPNHLFERRLFWVAARIAMAGAASAVVASALLPLALPLSALAGAAVYAASVYVLRVLTMADLRHLAARRRH
jgi:O-antigen/teichoic acid export membrane protein